MHSGEKIKALRKERKIKQQDLAKMLNIPQSHLSSIESGKMNLSKKMASKIGFALNVSPRYFDEDLDSTLIEQPQSFKTSPAFNTVMELEETISKIPDLKAAFETLHEYEDELSKLQDDHEKFFINPLKKIYSEIGSGKKAERVLSKNKGLVEIIIEYSNIVKNYHLKKSNVSQYQSYKTVKEKAKSLNL